MLVAILAGVAGASRVAEAVQPRARPCDAALPDSNRGVLRGQLLDDSTGQPLRHGVVVLLKSGCRAVAIGDGRFELTGIPLGDDHLEVLPLGYTQRLAPMAVSVKRSDWQDLVIRVPRGNRVTDCREMDACAALLRVNVAAERLEDSERLREAALRMNVALLVADGWTLGEFAICIDEPNPRIRAALMFVVPGVVPSSECSMAEKAPGAGRAPTPNLAHDPTGLKAARLRTATTRQPDGRVSAQLSSFVGPRGGKSWRCDFVNVDRIWTATSCRLDSIS